MTAPLSVSEALLALADECWPEATNPADMVTRLAAILGDLAHVLRDDPQLTRIGSIDTAGRELWNLILNARRYLSDLGLDDLDRVDGASHDPLTAAVQSQREAFAALAELRRAE